MGKKKQKKVKPVDDWNAATKKLNKAMNKLLRAGIIITGKVTMTISNVSMYVNIQGVDASGNLTTELDQTKEVKAA